MHLQELLALRPVPAAGVLAVVTARCPLHCAHCSSDSTMSSAEPDAAALLRFVASFAAAPPDVLLLTGGEPLLRPDTVRALAAAARTAGTRTAVLTGAFFARQRQVPARIMDAVTALDHFSVSIDSFHEREVPRAAVFRLLRHVLDGGVHASVHAVGSSVDDPYLAALVSDVRAQFGDAVPLLVTTVRPVGRAAAWRTASAPPVPGSAGGAVRPCPMAAWPVLTQDGAITACCNQTVVDRRPIPAHLTLGHLAVDDWVSVRGRLLGSPVLRTLRVAGPDYLRWRNSGQQSGSCGSLGSPADSTDPAGPTDPAPPGTCAGCRALPDRPRALQAAQRLGSGPLVRLLDGRPGAHGAALDLARRYGSPSHAELVTLDGGADR